MPNTYSLLGSSTVGSGGVASISFSSIDSSYTDLILKVSSRGASTGTLVLVSLNSSATTFKSTWLDGDGSAAGSGTNNSTLQNLMAWTQSSSTTANTFGNFEICFAGYSGSTKKSVCSDYVNENNSSGGIAYGLLGNNWTTTSAITSISLSIFGGTNFAQHSTAYLYGVKNA
jgi:hypothetical protein